MDSSTDTKPATWEYAGLLLTYWCNASCAFCYVYSSPKRGGSLDVEDAIRLWRSLDRLAANDGKRMRIHLAGGEPFGDWPRLASIVRAARDAGLTPLEKVETNAAWATTDGLTRSRLELLDALGMEMLIVSTDAYHEQFVPFERVRRCVEIARSVLGRGRVRVRWWDYFNNPANLRGLDQKRRREVFASALRHHQDRMIGRAADELADLLPRHPAAAFSEQHCVEAILESRHVHIDPHGNVFPGTCNGIILGNALREPPDQLWTRLERGWCENPVLAAVVEGGSFELIRRATEFGYRELETGYADKCHLCHHVRQFLHKRGVWPDAIGPAECYAESGPNQ